jgi:hypothetical protein
LLLLRDKGCLCVFKREGDYMYEATAKSKLVNGPVYDPWINMGLALVPNYGSSKCGVSMNINSSSSQKMS